MTNGPRVLLTLSRPTNEARIRSHDAYRDRLRDVGIDPIPLYPTDAAPESFDALVLSGGGDIHPSEYGDRETPDIEDVDRDRDALERTLIERARASGRPVLGICRGFQMLNVVYGGQLVQHIAGHRPKNAPIVPHRVVASAGSLLAEICGPNAFGINSRHHQAVTTVPAGLRATAMVDRYVEAVEAADGHWVLGVQWHPETKDDPPQDEAQAERIFQAFARAVEPVPAR